MKITFLSLLVVLAAWFATGCSKKETAGKSADGHDHAGHKHEHKAPHGGTAIVLGNETYHLELVLDAAAGKLSAYVLDGEMEKFIRIPAPAFEIVATVGDAKQTLLFNAVADAATGEKVGDTALFEASADWLKTTKSFDAVLSRIEIRGTVFSSVAFNFPLGNEK